MKQASVSSAVQGGGKRRGAWGGRGERGGSAAECTTGHARGGAGPSSLVGLGCCGEAGAATEGGSDGACFARSARSHHRRVADDRGALSGLVTSPAASHRSWSVDEADPKLDRRCFIVRDAKGQALAYVYFEGEIEHRAAAHPLTRDETATSRRTLQSCLNYCSISKRRGVIS